MYSINDHRYYDSKEHHDFCNKWNVSGSIEEYHLWRKMLDNFDEEVSHKHYLKLLMEVKYAFNLPDDENYSVALHHTLFKRKTYFYACQLARSTPPNKIQIEIWTGDNLVTMLRDRKDVLSVSELREIEREFIVPILKIIDKARASLGCTPLISHKNTLELINGLVSEKVTEEMQKRIGKHV